MHPVDADSGRGRLAPPAMALLMLIIIQSRIEPLTADEPQSLALTAAASLTLVITLSQVDAFKLLVQ